MEPNQEPNQLDNNKTTNINSATQISGAILIAGVIIAGAILLKGTSDIKPTKKTDSPLSAFLELTENDVILGNKKAPITIIEYGDYQCPFCGRFFEQIEKPLREEYIQTGKVKMVFRNFQFLSEESYNSAQAVECAKDQGKFWEFHDAIYEEENLDGEEHNKNLNRDLFMKIARANELDEKSFAECYDSEKYLAKIKQESELASQNGINSTPTSFVNGEKVQGDYQKFRTIIESQL